MEEFNVVICGMGGQGVLTLMEIIALAAKNQGYEVRTSEVHGLSQRFGSIQTHVRFGKNIYSPLVMQNDADLIIALEPLESLRVLNYASEKTAFLINTYKIPPQTIYLENVEYPSLESIEKEIKKITQKVFWVDATSASIKHFGSAISTNIAMLAYSLKLNLLPITKENVLKGMGERWKDERFEKNKELIEKILKGEY